MENETPEVVTPEIVPNESNSNTTNPVGHLAVMGLAVIGTVQVAKTLGKRYAFQLPIVRRSKVEKTPVVTETPTPVVAE